MPTNPNNAIQQLSRTKFCRANKEKSLLLFVFFVITMVVNVRIAIFCYFLLIFGWHRNESGCFKS